MATVTEMRAWLRANTSEDIPARGRLQPRLVQMYEDANGTTTADDDWDLPATGDDDTAFPDELEPSVPVQPERPPRTPRTQRAEHRAAQRAQPVTQRASTWLGRLLGSDVKKDAAKKGKKIPRTSLEKLVTAGYREAGKILMPLSRPTAMCIQIQAPFAGVVLEETFRNTIIDRFLQPAARAEDKLGVVGALVMTPAAVLAAEQTRIAVQAGMIT